MSRIYELPDIVSAVAGSLIANAAGDDRIKTVVLVTPEEIDQAAQKSASFRPPGG